MTAPHPVATLAARECRCARISPDGTSVLTVGAGRMRMWDASSGHPGWSRDWEALVEFPVEAVWGASGDSVTVLSSGRLSRLDAVAGTDLPVPDQLAGRRDVTALALSPDGLTLAVGTSEGATLLWRQDIGSVTRLRGGGDPVTALAWRPSSAELCIARPRSTQFWQMVDETMISSIDMRDMGPLRLAWAPDGELIVVLGLRDVRVLGVASRRESVPPLPTGGRPLGLGVSRSGAILLVGMPDGSLAWLDRQLRPAAFGWHGPAAGLVEAAGLHVNETGLVALRTGAATVTLFRLPDTVPADEDRARTVALRRWAAGLLRTPGSATPDAPAAPVPTTLARASGFAWAAQGWYLQNRTTAEVTRFGADGSLQWTATAGTGALAADDRYLAVDRADGRITVLDAASGGHLATLAGVGPVAWSSQAAAVAAPLRRDLLVYDLNWSPRTVPIPDGSGDPAWSPDGRTLLATSATAIVAWDAESLQRIRRVDIGAATRPAAAVWAPNGRRFALNRPGSPVTVWRVDTWQPDQALVPSAADGAQALAWSPDSQLLAIPTPRPIGAVELWDVEGGRLALTIPPPPVWPRPVAKVDWAMDGRLAVVHDDGTVVRWQLAISPADAGGTPPPHPASIVAALVAATASCATMVSPWLLSDLLSLVLGRGGGRLAELEGQPGVALLRGLRWPTPAAVGLAVLVAAGLPPEPDLLPPPGVDGDEIRAAVEHAFEDVSMPAVAYQPPMADLIGELNKIDDSTIMLATLLGPDAVAAAPDLLARSRAQSFGAWTFAPQQRRLLGLRSVTRLDGTSQGHGAGGARAGIARHGQLPSLLPAQLALPRTLLAVKKSRDELLFRTREGDMPVLAQPVVLLLDDTPAAFGAVGVTLRLVANLLAAVAIRRHHRCALVPLASARTRLLGELADLVHLWATGNVDGPDLPAALAAARAAAAQLSDPQNGFPRLVLLTHPYLGCPSRPGLHVVRVHYPGRPMDDPAPRTHVLSPDASAAEIHRAVGEILADRS